MSAEGTRSAPPAAPRADTDLAVAIALLVRDVVRIKVRRESDRVALLCEVVAMIEDWQRRRHAAPTARRRLKRATKFRVIEGGKGAGGGR